MAKPRSVLTVTRWIILTACLLFLQRPQELFSGTRLFEVDVFKDGIIPTVYQDSIRAGTCMTDMSPYIQGAIDSLSPHGGIIYFPTGRFRIDIPLKIPSSLATAAANAPRVQLIGSTSFLGGVRDHTDPPGWNGTTLFTPSTTLTAFIYLNIRLFGQRVITNYDWLTGWRISGFRFEGGSANSRARRQAIRGSFVTHGTIEDCAFVNFSPPDGSAVVDFGYLGLPEPPPNPYNENILINRALFSRCTGTSFRGGPGNDNLRITDCYSFATDGPYWCAPDSLWPTVFATTSYANTVAITGGIWGVKFEPTKPFTLLDAHYSTALSVSSVHCEGISRIVGSQTGSNILVQGSYFHVPDSTFNLVSFGVDSWPKIFQNSVSIINNTLDLKQDIPTPTRLFLTCGAGCDTTDFPLGVFTGNVAFYGATYRRLPTRFGRRDLEIDHETGNVSARGSINLPNAILRCDGGDFLTEIGSPVDGFEERMRLTAAGVLNVGRVGQPSAAVRLSVNGSLATTGTIKVGTSGAAAIPGTMRYRKSGNNTYFEVCMEDSTNRYVWFTLKTYSW